MPERANEQRGSVFATLKMLAVWLTLGPLEGIWGIIYTNIVGDITAFYWATMWVVRAGVRAAGITVLLEGRENIPADRAAIFMSNHVSNLDPPVLMPAIPQRMVIMLKKSLMKIPILGTAMHMARFIPVERGSRRDTAKATVEAAAAALAEGLPIVVFPEGTRSIDGRLSQFKKGPFFLALQTGAPIVPVAISGTEKMMRKGSNWIAPGVARIQMLPVIRPQDYDSREALTAAVHAAIAAALPEEMKPLATLSPEAI
jgi:1-acyl-sn-glycerol-3-phosphate acyltransferase